jgi:hypothetical protein
MIDIVHIIVQNSRCKVARLSVSPGRVRRAIQPEDIRPQHIPCKSIAARPSAVA